MKKVFVQLLTLVLVICCALTSVACTPKPSFEFKQVKKVMEELDYSVEIEQGDDFYGEYGVIEMLIAYEDDGNDELTIVKFSNKKIAKVYYNLMKFEAEKNIEEVKLMIKSGETILKEMRDELSSEEIDDLEDEKKDYKKELKDIEEEGRVYGISGYYVWYGTENAIKDSKAK